MNELFTEGQEVLVRDWEDQKWKRYTFRHYEWHTTLPYRTDCHSYRYCIPYEGNEHLENTTLEYKGRGV